MKKVKITAFVLVLLMLFPLLISCGKSTDGTQGNSVSTTQQDNSQATAQSETTTEGRIEPDVPAGLNLNGYKFRLLYNSAEYDASQWGVAGIEAAEETGDVINDAAYTRNANATEKYNFELDGFSQLTTSLDTSFVKKIILAGADDYDAIIIRQTMAPSLITSGSFVDLNTVPYLDFDKPWWDKSIMNQLSIDNKKFAGFGDFIVTANDAIRIMMFNKTLLKDNGLEDPYALVRNGAWTLDKLNDMSKGISADLNGDGVMDKNDRYGFLLQTSSVICLSFGAGETITSKDANDLPVLSVGNDRALPVFQKIYDIVKTPNLTLFDSAFTDTYVGLQAAFENNQGLFYAEVLQLVARMRSSDTDFGILPFPKYDDSQQNYYDFSDSWCGNDIFIPVTNQHIEQTGQILEILNAESYYTMRPAYYDVSLNGKFMRDTESSEMLDIILSSKIISLDEMFGWGMYGALNGAMNGKSPDFASVIEKNTAKVQNAIDKSVKLIQGLQ